MSKPYIPTFEIIVRRSFDGKVEGERSWKLSAVGTYVDKLEDAIAFVADSAMDAYGLKSAQPRMETRVTYWTCPKCQEENRDDYHRISCPHCASMRPTANRGGDHG